ncbi:MAG: HAMP domain-containing sensor histidine kinase [Terriglobia bacterium]
MKILLIYHQPETLAILEEFAEAGKHTLVFKGGVEEVLSSPDNLTSDLVLIELGNSTPVIKQLLQSRKTPPPPTLFLGKGTDEEISLAFDSGAYSFLQTPLHPKLLQMSVQSILDRIQLEKSILVVEDEKTKVQQELDGSVERQREAIAERELTYRELLLAYSRLQELNQLKNNFLAKATHELRTPVTVIKGYHRILLDERLGELLPQQKEVLLESEQSCARLIRIVNSLLDFSRIEAGKLELIYQEYDLTSNVKLVMSQIKESADKKDLQVRVKIEKHVPKLSCDRDKMNQVLANLLDNAVKFTPPGGRISVMASPYYWDRRSLPHQRRGTPSSRPAETAEPPAGEGMANNSVLIEVCDTGCGISAEHQREIFEEFTQIPSQLSQRSGLGLGLAISRRIIEAHGGKIWVESEIGQGSRFALILPVSPVEASGGRRDID